MIGFVVVWSGSLERSGKARSLSGYLGGSSLKHADPVDWLPGDTQFPRKKHASEKTCPECGLSKGTQMFARSPRGGRFTICASCVALKWRA